MLCGVAADPIVDAVGNELWIDPAEELIAIFMTQVLPSTATAIRRELRTMIYSAITDSNV